MDYITNIRLPGEHEAALKAAAVEHDRTQAYLIRKAIEIVYILKLVDITTVPRPQAEQAVA